MLSTSVRTNIKITKQQNLIKCNTSITLFLCLVNRLEVQIRYFQTSLQFLFGVYVHVPIGFLNDDLLKAHVGSRLGS